MLDSSSASLGEIELVQDIAGFYDASNVLLITGRSSFEKCGASNRIHDALQKYTVHRFSDVHPNPSDHCIGKAIQAVRETQPDLVVAIGGGSVIDVAKVSRCVATDGWPPRLPLENADLKSPRVPLVAVPTTAGTGSETTQFAAYYVGRRKSSIDHESLKPDHIILDPSLTRAMPRWLAASSGMDALTQAIESMWAITSTKDSRRLSRRAIELLWPNIVEAASGEAGRDCREAMLIGASYSGRAINITRTTAPHALSYYLTAHHGIPHGHAVACTLGDFLVYNYGVTDADASDKRGAQFARDRIHEILDLLKADDVTTGRAQWVGMMRSVGLDPAASRRVVERDLEAWVAAVNVERLINNPRQASADDLKAILSHQLS